MSEIVLPVLLPVESRLEMKEEMSMKFLRTPRGGYHDAGIEPRDREYVYRIQTTHVKVFVEPNLS